MKTYKLSNNGILDWVIELVDGIPMGGFVATENQEYQDFLSTGGKPQSADVIDNTPIVRADRDARIAAVSWRYERYAREVRLGLTSTDDIAVLDKYIQALADIPNQKGFPDKVMWPTL